MRGLYRLSLIYREIRSRILLQKALASVARFPNVTPQDKHGLPAPLIITLTSYPPRFPDLSKTLRSLLDQNVPADAVQLWIAHDDLDDLPQDVLALKAAGLEIKTCEDLRSYKKLIPALKERPHCFYVTADDDVYYPPEWLAGLVSTAKENPETIIATRSHMAHRKDDGMLAPYSDWELAASQTENMGDGRILFPTGVGGILYPPRWFGDEALDQELFMNLCPKGDDIWFFWMARKAGTPHRRTPDHFDIVDWPNSQDVALARQNLHSDGNDGQIQAMEAHFGPVPEAPLKTESAP